MDLGLTREDHDFAKRFNALGLSFIYKIRYPLNTIIL